MAELAEFPTKRTPPAQLCHCGVAVYKVVESATDSCRDEVVVRCSACALRVEDCSLDSCR